MTTLVCLFTNTPLDEALDIVVYIILEKETNLKIGKESLKYLFVFAT